MTEAIADEPETETTADWRAVLRRQGAALPPRLRAADALLLRGTEWILVLIGGLFTLMVALEVVSRFSVGFGTFFISAAAKFLLLWFFLLGSGMALRLGSHVGFDLLVAMQPRRLQRIVRLAAQLLALVFFAEMIWAGLLSLGPARLELDLGLSTSLLWGFLAVPISFALMFYHMLILMIAERRGTGGDALDDAAGAVRE